MSRLRRQPTGATTTIWDGIARANAGRLKCLARAGAHGGRLVDVGCATGFFLDEAREAGWKVAGVDCSPWARSMAARQLGLETFESLTEARENAAAPFQAVTLFQVLEHLADPAEALREVAAALEPGGTLVVETWDRESLVARLCKELATDYAAIGRAFIFASGA
jgi:2-polyprenyl-3-methyl-5-hydroxy-6-metoxy-1,4-benzoquinol methylase